MHDRDNCQALKSYSDVYLLIDTNNHLQVKANNFW